MPLLLGLGASVGVFAVSALLTGLLRTYLVARGLLDVPNPRSSHAIATPRGGGLSIVLAATCGVLSLALIGGLFSKLLAVLLGGGASVALLGLVDDRRGLSPAVKLSAHFAIAIWAVACLGGPRDLVLAHGTVVHLGWMGDVLAVLAVTWTLNLFNFMDGIDGLAASEGAFVLCTAAALTALVGVSRVLTTADVIVGVACLGFLLWNWPPARIFMGDVGSSYLGYMCAVLALAAMRQSAVALWIWLILGGVFFIDATTTLLRRLFRGERLLEAHRCHAYQWLARRRGHRAVTLAVCAVNLLWLLPCALVAALQPARAAIVTLIALVPVICVVLVAGAGRVASAPGPAASRRSPHCATQSEQSDRAAAASSN